MQNDPELNGKYLGTISSDFAKISDVLKEAAYQVKKRGFSDHPIFPISKERQPIGQELISRHKAGLEWNYSISYLDEFVQRELIKQERIELFVSNYKDPEEFCCLFVIDEGFTSFLYIPYPED